MDEAGEQAGWSVLAVELPQRHGDELIGMMSDLALGAETESLPGDRARIRLYLRSRALEERAAAALRRRLEDLDLDPEVCRMRREYLDDLRWAERYQASLRPFPLGMRFLVVPDGGAHSVPQRTSIRLVPSRAFGTGEHPTTRMCAELLEERVRPGSRWLDLGCGSGILSVVAAHCGAEEVLGVDADPEAVEVARGVVAENGLTGRVELATGSAERPPAGRWDGVVANISSAFFLEQAPGLPGLLAPAGILLATGYVVDDRAAVAAALAAAGLEERERRESPPWGLLVLHRAG